MTNSKYEEIFKPLEFRNLTVKNRIFRSSITGRWDDYHGSGTQARLNWERQFAQGGVGTIISSYVPVNIEGRITPNVATIHDDDTIPFWEEVGKTVHKAHKDECRYILQLSHSGRQREVEGVENMQPNRYRPKPALSSTNQKESISGIPCRRMNYDEILRTIDDFAEAALRAKVAGLDGVETHSAHGYLITQFLSSAINDCHRSEDPNVRKYGGSLENRYRFLQEIVQAIRSKVGKQFHFQTKIGIRDFNNVLPWEPAGDREPEAVQICKWLERDGVDAIHVTAGSTFPHPINPAGFFPFEVFRNTYDTMLSSAKFDPIRNYILFRSFNWIFSAIWNWKRFRGGWRQPFQGTPVKDVSTLDRFFLEHVKLEEIQQLLTDFQGMNLEYAKLVKEAVDIPVICTGGFQQASYINQAIKQQFCDGVTIARPLIANPALVDKYFARDQDLAEKPCTYCNNCTGHYLENPLGCYDIRRFYEGSVQGLSREKREQADQKAYDSMIEKVMEVFQPHMIE